MTKYKKEEQIENAKKEIIQGIQGLVIIIITVAVILIFGKDSKVARIIAGFIGLVSIGFIFDIRRGLNWLDELKK